jgi:uncharacterized protein YndB with AHSA1/START domain
MEIDITRCLGAVSRRLTTTKLDGQDARVITVSREYDSDLADVWDALTNQDRLPRWFVPVTGDLREGGRYQIEGNASGTILRCVEQEAFDLTWEFGGMTSWVNVRLSPTEQGTHLQLEHIAISIPEDQWDQYGPGAAGVGWDMALMGLGRHLETGQANNSEESMAWMMSANGKEFMRESSRAWAQADIAAGEAEDVALAAAERTRAAYCGEVQ